MGHDIIAGQFTQEQLEHIRERLGLTVMTTEQWTRRFEGLDQQNWAGFLRRAAQDRYNKVIYRALDVEDKHYGGCSGNGNTHTFTYAEVKAAKSLLPSIVADQPPPIDTTELEKMGALLNAMFAISGDDKFNIHPVEMDEGSSGIEDEEKFLDDVLSWMQQRNEATVEIFFG